MRRFLAVLAAAAVRRRLSLRPRRAPSRSAVIGTYSGPFADTATQMDNGIKLYMKRMGDTVAGQKIEIIRKDSGGIEPDIARGWRRNSWSATASTSSTGLVLTPNTFAVADISAQAKKPMIIMNAGTSIVTAEVRLQRARVDDGTAADRTVRDLGRQAGHQTRLHHGVGLRARP